MNQHRQRSASGPKIPFVKPQGLGKMHINVLQVQDFKRIKMVKVEPRGKNMVVVAGANGSGKSSMIDSIIAVLCGNDRLPRKPIRDGQPVAKIQCDLGEIVVMRKFLEGGNPSGHLEVLLTKANAPFRQAQSLLDALRNAVSVDPLEFKRMDPETQLDVLQQVAPVDIDLPELDAANAADYKNRGQLNAFVKSNRQRLEDARKNLPVGKAPSKVDVTELRNQIENARERNSNIFVLSRQADDAGGAERPVHQTGRDRAAPH